VLQPELLRKMATTLEKLGVPYAVVGSTASTAYGEARLTNDIDIVLDLQLGDVDRFCNEFPDPEFYLSRRAVESAVQRRFQFNIIHPTSGLKVDCILAGNNEFDRNQLARAIRVARKDAGYTVQFASPEDVILKKMEYFRLGQSEKHTRDICGILKEQGDRIDRDYIRQWAEKMDLTEIWEAILVRISTG
jgi:predicted nucleotidyltransferase